MTPGSQMAHDAPIHILGAGAIGLPLAAHLAHRGRTVVVVRTSPQHASAPARETVVTVQHGSSVVNATVATTTLEALEQPGGLVVVTAKAHANASIAGTLRDKHASGPIVLLQNGVGVERPFLEAGFAAVFRCVLYVTSQATESPNGFNTRPIASSPIGPASAEAVSDTAALERIVATLTTPGLPFHADANVGREVWKKAIINAAFNSVCPLLDTDNGVFARDPDAERLARELVRECLTLTDRLGFDLSEDEIATQLLRISQGSDGQLISTLQDIRAGRRTEIEFLNLEMARMAANLEPALSLPRVELLGRLVALKSGRGL